MVEAQNKIVSIASFRAAKPETKTPADRSSGAMHARPASGLSPRSVEHRERMLRFLRAVAVEGRPGTPPQGEQGRLLL